MCHTATHALNGRVMGVERQSSWHSQEDKQMSQGNSSHGVHDRMMVLRATKTYRRQDPVLTVQAHYYRPCVFRRHSKFPNIPSSASGLLRKQSRSIVFLERHFRITSRTLQCHAAQQFGELCPLCTTLHNQAFESRRVPHQSRNGFGGLWKKQCRH